MKALVLGATGRIGNAVVRELLALGAAVTATSRRAEPPENLVGLPVDYRAGDADRPGQLDAWTKGHELVVDAAAPYPLWLAEDGSVAARFAAAERRVESLLHAVAGHGAGLVHVGSFVTEPRPRPLLARAQTRALRALHPYFELKRRMEARVTAAMREGHSIAVVRPTFCIGPWDIGDASRAFIPMVVNGALPALNAHAMNVIDVRDVAGLIAAAVARGRYGRCISAVGHDTTLELFVDLICRTAGVSRPSWRVPAQLAAAGAYANELLRAAFGRERDQPAVGALLLLEQTWAEPGREQRALGLQLRPLSRSVADALDWYERRVPPSSQSGLRAETSTQ